MAGYLSVLLEELFERVVVKFITKVLNENVGKHFGLLAELFFAFGTRYEFSNVDLLAVEQHAVNLFDGFVGSVFGLEMDEAVTLGRAGVVLSDFAAQNRSEGRKRVVHGLVVDAFVEVLNEDVSNAGLAQGGVALRPHDPDGASLHEVEIHGVEGAFGIGWLMEVDVRIPEGSARNYVPADME